MKLNAELLFVSDLKPFFVQFKRDCIPYSESIHEIVKSVLNSQNGNTLHKIQAIQLINQYELSESEDAEFYTEARTMIERQGKIDDKDLKKVVNQAREIMKVDENERNKLTNRALFDWYISYPEI